MKYLLHLNQFALIDFKGRLHENNVDYNDLMIFTLLLDKISEGDLTCDWVDKLRYFHFNWRYVKHNLPFLNISSNQAYKYRLNKLEKAGLIVRNKHKGYKKMFIRPGGRVKIENWAFSSSDTSGTKNFVGVGTKNFVPSNNNKNKGPDYVIAGPRGGGKEWVDALKKQLGNG